MLFVWILFVHSMSKYDFSSSDSSQTEAVWVLPGGVSLYSKCVCLSFSLTEELPAKSSRILSGNTLSEHPPLFYKRHSRPTLPAVPYFRDHSSSPLSQQRLPSSQPHTKTKTQLVLSIGRSWPKNGLKVCLDCRES